MLNAYPYKSYRPTRGLRQGDPLSPYTFIICMETFSRYLLHAESNNLIHGLKVCKDAPSISHLLFADDCLIFAKASHSKAANLLSLIKDFSLASGQVINLQKSGCFFSSNVHSAQAVSLINDLKVKKIVLNEKYLGIPLFITRSRTDSFNYLNDHFDKRVAKWKGNHFNQDGRSVMVQNVLKSSPIYHMNTFTIPDNIINSMESSQRYFWWGKSRQGGIYFRAWPRICSHKYQGGLGFRNLKHMNLSLLSKTAWKLIHNPDALWVIILRYKYFRNCHPFHHPKKLIVLGLGEV